MHRREKLFWLVAGFVLILGVISLIPAHHEICKESAKAGEEACPSYRLVPFLIIEVGKVLDALGVAITALATIAIAWFTWSLRRSTDKLWDAGERQLKLLADTSAAQSRDMQGSIKAAESAAEAAQDAASGLKSAERPHMVVSELKVSGRNSDPNAEENVEILLAIQVMNFGRSPAFARELSLQIIFGKELPGVPAYSATQQLRGATVPTRSWGTEWPTKIDVPALLVQLSNAQEAEMFVFGYFKYADIFEMPHETAFAYQILFDPGADSSKHFAAADPGAYWRYT